MGAQHFVQVFGRVNEKARRTNNLENALEEIEWDLLCHLGVVAVYSSEPDKPRAKMPDFRSIFSSDHPGKRILRSGSKP